MSADRAGAKDSDRGSGLWLGLGLAAGPLLWLAHFGLVYGSASLICSGYTLGPLSLRTSMAVVIGAFTLAALGINLYLVTRQGRRWQRERIDPASTAPAFMAGTRALLNCLSALGVTWVGLSALLHHPCA